jgi:hypothetical protein
MKEGTVTGSIHTQLNDDILYMISNIGTSFFSPSRLEGDQGDGHYINNKPGLVELNNEMTWGQ